MGTIYALAALKQESDKHVMLCDVLQAKWMFFKWLLKKPVMWRCNGPREPELTLPTDSFTPSCYFAHSSILFLLRPPVHTQGSFTQIQRLQSLGSLGQCHLLVTPEITSFSAENTCCLFPLVSCGPGTVLLHPMGS